MDEMSILLHQTISLGEARYRLESILGGGATAVVFLGKDPDDPDKQAAIKVAKPDEQWQSALHQEFSNLCRLAQAEAKREQKTHYFPRILAPQSESLMPTSFLGKNYLVIAQELVKGIGVHDLTLAYQDLCLPEPLALEIARQYADMLVVLHDTELTCADRKLADLRWQTEYDFHANNRDNLHAWQNGNLLGRLIVLDWNVTSRATVEEKNLDLFRFGILWHRMLLGEEPRFRRGGKWQLEEPLPHHPLWRSLSIPTRRILAKLLHPFLEKRYQNARTLLYDLDRTLKLWKQSVDALWQQETLEATSVLRIRVTQWGEEPPLRLEKKYRRLWRESFIAPSDQLQKSISLQRWGDAQVEIERLKDKYAYHPAMWLHLDRLEKIVRMAIQDGQVRQIVESLRRESERIFVRDYPDNIEESSDSGTWEINEQNIETEQNPNLKEVKKRLLYERKYREELKKARKASEKENWQEASESFKQVTEYRTALGEKVRDYLDLIYGNPTQEQEKVGEIIKRGVDIQSAIIESMRQLIEAQTLEDVRKITVGLQVVRRVAPRNRILSDLRILLEAELAWQQAKGNRLLEIHFLKRLQQQWQVFQKTLEGYNEADLFVQRIEKKLKNRQSDLRTRILSNVISPPTKEYPQIYIKQLLRFQPLLEMYYRTFPEDDTLSTNLQQWLSYIHQALQNELSISDYCTRQSVLEKEMSLSNLLHLEKALRPLAELIGAIWAEKTASTTLEQKIEEIRATQIQVAALSDLYFGLQSGGE